MFGSLGLFSGSFSFTCLDCNIVRNVGHSLVQNV